MQDVIETDVAIVGGGLAGLFVAMGAAEQGARVVVMEKAKIERSGAIAGGVDPCLAYLNEGEWWDTRDGYADAGHLHRMRHLRRHVPRRCAANGRQQGGRRVPRRVLVVRGLPDRVPGRLRAVHVSNHDDQGLAARGASPAWHRRSGRGRQGKRRSLLYRQPARPASAASRATRRARAGSVVLASRRSISRRAAIWACRRRCSSARYFGSGIAGRCRTVSNVSMRSSVAARMAA